MKQLLKVLKKGTNFVYSKLKWIGSLLSRTFNLLKNLLPKVAVGVLSGIVIFVMQKIRRDTSKLKQDQEYSQEEIDAVLKKARENRGRLSSALKKMSALMLVLSLPLNGSLLYAEPVKVESTLIQSVIDDYESMESIINWQQEELVRIEQENTQLANRLNCTLKWKNVLIVVGASELAVLLTIAGVGAYVNAK